MVNERELYKKVIGFIRELTTREQELNDKPYTPGIYYATDAGRCMRQVFFKYKLGITNDINDKGRGRILMSQIIEKIYLDVLEEMGYETHKKFEKKYNDIVVRGEVDAVNDKEVIEIKSVTPTAMHDIPFIKDIKQLNTYLWLADKQKGVLIYVKSDNPTIFRIFNYNFSQSMLEESLDHLYKIHEYISSNVLPPPTKVKKFCRTCAFREICDKITELERKRV